MVSCRFSLKSILSIDTRISSIDLPVSHSFASCRWLVQWHLPAQGHVDLWKQGGGLGPYPLPLLIWGFPEIGIPLNHQCWWFFFSITIYLGVPPIVGNLHITATGTQTSWWSVLMPLSLRSMRPCRFKKEGNYWWTIGFWVVPSKFA